MYDSIKALSVFAGTIIGVGIFGLPYVASKSGFFIVLFYFLLMSGIAIAVHLLLSQVALGTEKPHRLPGYVGEYLGSGWKKFSLLMIGFGLTGAILAYLIVGGEFLKLLFAPYIGGGSLIYTFIFFGAGAFLIFRGIKNIAQIELALLVVFFVILFVFFAKAVPFINFNFFKPVDWKFFSLPYGVILFSLWGSAVVPEVKEMLAGDEKKLKRVITAGILISTLTYLFFIFTILGVSGPNTSKEAISGLASGLGNGIIRFGFIFGVITCFTSFITLGLTLKKILWYDFNISENLAFCIACFLPLFLFLVGLREFIDIIGFTGALALGGEGIITIFLYQKFLEKKGLRKMNPLMYFLPLVFVLGIILEIFYYF